MYLDHMWGDYYFSNIAQFCHFYPGPLRDAIFKIDEIIISSETLWTENFTPPTAALQVASAQVGVTKLLLHMNGADASRSFPDSSPEMHTVTANGTAQIDTASFVLGGASGLFGPGNYLSILDDSYWNIFNSDWTIDFRFRIPAITLPTYTIFEQTVDATTFMRCTYEATNHRIVFNVQIGGINKIMMTAPATLVADTWYHIALTASNWEQV